MKHHLAKKSMINPNTPGLMETTKGGHMAAVDEQEELAGEEVNEQ